MIEIKPQNHKLRHQRVLLDDVILLLDHLDQIHQNIRLALKLLHSPVDSFPRTQGFIETNLARTYDQFERMAETDLILPFQVE